MAIAYAIFLPCALPWWRVMQQLMCHMLTKAQLSLRRRLGLAAGSSAFGSDGPASGGAAAAAPTAGRRWAGPTAAAIGSQSQPVSSQLPQPAAGGQQVTLTVGPALAFEEGSVYCASCDMWLNGQVLWEDHKIGKKHGKKRLENEHMHDACKDLSRLDQASFRLKALPLILTRRFLARCVPPTPANKVLRRAQWRSEIWESIVALASGSHSGRRIAFLMIDWVGRLPPQPKPQPLASGSYAEQPLASGSRCGACIFPHTSSSHHEVSHA